MNATHNTDNADRLVCGVDRSPHAANVVAVASQLADRLGLNLVLVHSPDPDIVKVGERRLEALERGEARLDELTRPDVAHERIVELGDPTGLLTATLHEGATLAVVGRRPRGNVRAALLGSTSHALATTAPCPVVVVPPAATVDSTPASTVVCGVDGSDDAFAALAAAASISARLGIDLVAVHVRSLRPVPPVPEIRAAPYPMTDILDAVDPADDAIRDTVAALGEQAPTRLVIEHADPAQRLMEVARREQASLLVVGSRGMGPLRSAVMGSVSGALTAAAPVPVMVVPPTAHLALDGAWLAEPRRSSGTAPDAALELEERRARNGALAPSSTAPR